MTNPLLYVLRRMALRRNGSHLPHGLRPLDSVGSVAILFSAEGEENEAIRREAAKQFAGKSLRLLCPSKQDVDILGTLKKKYRGDAWSDELFITLIEPSANFLSEYEARCSKAVFKVGRSRIAGDVFDLVLSDPEGESKTQYEALLEIVKYLLIIR